MRTLAAVLLAMAGASHAAVIAEVRDGDRLLQLTDEVGPCLGNAKVAVWSQGEQRVPGCYVLRARTLTVHVAFLDGDAVEVPIDVFKTPVGV